MSRFRLLITLGALAAAASLSVVASAQERSSPPRPGHSTPPAGSYQRTCRGISMNGNMLSAQCTGPTGAPVHSSIDTNGCRGRDIANDRGYLRCNGGGPRPPVPPRPIPPRPIPPRPVPPVPPGGNFEAIAYTGANYRGQTLRIRGPIANLANHRGFNDNIRSLRIVRGRAQICVDAIYRGRCVTVSRSTSDLNSIGMGNRISSIR